MKGAKSAGKKHSDGVGVGSRYQMGATSFEKEWALGLFEAMEWIGSRQCNSDLSRALC